MKVNIIDCTIRDGSYVVDYRMTIRDVAILGRALEEAGVEFIEIGHGVGLQGSRPGTAAAQSDEEYCIAAQNTFRRANWGMFLIPGIGTIKDLETAAEKGMQFCRIGCDIDKVESAEEFVMRGRELGLFTTINFMKSYAADPQEFARKVKVAASYGADVVYLVDSAGGMLPDEVRAYVRAARDAGVKLGFHGHNNLSLAVANTIAAAEEGCIFLDACLQGLGRSAGNAITESLLLALDRKGIETGIDTMKVLDIGERFVRPMLQARGGLASLDLIMGYAQFHSSFLPIVEEIAEAEGVDVRELIVEATKKDKIGIDKQALIDAAGSIEKDHSSCEYRGFDNIPRLFPARSDETAEIIREVQATARKSNKTAVITVEIMKQCGTPPIRENKTHVIGNLEVADKEQALSAISEAHNIVDLILLDRGDMPAADFAQAWELGAIPYHDPTTLVQSLANFITQLYPSPDANVCIIGSFGGDLQTRLSRLGFNITTGVDRDAAAGDVDILVNTSTDAQIGSDLVKKLRQGSIIIDGVRGGLSDEAVLAARDCGVELYRFDTRAGLFATVIAADEMRQLVNVDLGTLDFKEFQVVAGGVIGKLGDVVVDSIKNPRRIVGISDGRGGLVLDDESRAERIKEVEAWILDGGR